MKPSSSLGRGLWPGRTGGQGGSEDGGNAWRNAALPPDGPGFSTQGLFISTELPFEGQMLLAKTGPWVAQRQIIWGGEGGTAQGVAAGWRSEAGEAAASPPSLEGKPVSPETSQFYSECFNSFEKCKNQLRGGRVSPGEPRSSWGRGEMLGPRTFSPRILQRPSGSAAG